MRVLAGVDGSDRSLQAIDETIATADEAEIDLTVVVYGDTEATVLERQVRDHLAERGVEATVEHAGTDPGAALVDRAETGGYDRIVMPGGTRSPLGKIQFDSTVEFVLLNAQTSITLVR